MKTPYLTTILVFSLLGCGSLGIADTSGKTPGTGGDSASKNAGVVPGTVGLSKAALEDIPDPIRFNYKRDVSLPLHRFNKYAPPVIPHDISDLALISKKQNECLDCHEPGPKVSDGPPAIPVSHLINHRTGEKSTKLTYARYNCTMCHVPQSDAVPLVGNTYQP